MTSRDFCFWLQGYFELANTPLLGAPQQQVVRDHLNMVFKHEIDPSMGNQQHQGKLNNLHGGKGPDGETVRC